MENKKVILVISYFILLLLGLFLTLNSVNIAENKSKQQISENAYTVDGSDVSRNMIPFVTIGSITFLLGGFGIVITISKD